MTQMIKSEQGKFQDIVISQGWNYKEPDAQEYTFNDITNAYIFGKEHGEKGFAKILMNGVKNNIKHAQEIGRSFYTFLKKNQIKIKQVRLRIVSPTEFNLICLIKNESFISKGFNKVLNESHKIMDKNDNTLGIDMKFLPYNKYVNIDKLLADGYLLSYEEK